MGRLVASILVAGLGFAGVGRGVAQMASPTAACGRDATQFDVSAGAKGQEVVAPAPGKAQLYFIELNDPHDKGRFGRPTIRHGVDGAWLGATQGLSYLHVEVDPGPHHLCSRWQSHFSRLTDEVSLNNLVAEPGRTYFFRVQIAVQSAGDVGYPTIDLQPISEDEGRLLVSLGAESVSKAK